LQEISFRVEMIATNEQLGLNLRERMRMAGDFPTQDGPNYADATSLSLLQRAQSDDQDAWDRLVRLYGPLVYRWCQRASVPADDVSDVFQEVFRAVAASLKKYKPGENKGSFRAWLKTVARSKISNHFQYINRQVRGKGGSTAQNQMSAATDPLGDPLADEDEEVDEADHAVLVRRALELIRPEFKDTTWVAFERVALEDRDVAFVGEELGLSSAAVRQANYRVRRRLRIELGDLFDFS